jgi:hypothetical protein
MEMMWNLIMITITQVNTFFKIHSMYVLNGLLFINDKVINGLQFIACKLYNRVFKSSPDHCNVQSSLLTLALELSFSKF